jgi:hypothetical protein
MLNFPEFIIPAPIKQRDFISAKRAAKLVGISSSRIRLLASQGRVEGAFFDEKKGWRFPKSGIFVSPGTRGPAFGSKRGD